MAEFNFSVLSQASVADQHGVLADALDAALHATGRADRWHVSRQGFWRSVQPLQFPRRAQGWKLHLSATPASAEQVLTRSLPVLLAADSAFKFAATLDHVAHLNARHTPRGHSGKFITVYPRDDAEAVRLADALHHATAGLPGPRILSDRPYEPTSLVHYRYGAFVEERRIGTDGLYAWVIMDPDGNPVEDRRTGQYVPPAWAQCPFPVPAPAAPSAAGDQRRDGGVLIGDRFLVREAIRHVNKGGVYRATDTETGADAVIKEARPHVAADMSGRDVRDLLRAEARALERIGPLGAAPKMLALFEQGQHLFLAEELVPGTSLRQWVLDRIKYSGWRRRIPDAVQTAQRLVELMDRAHRGGLILRDFTPNNVMVLPDGELRLIDLELAVATDDEDVVTGAGTPGFAPPEQMAGAAPAVEADHYSLGASICFVFIGATPDLLAESEPARPMAERLAEWLSVRQAPDTPAEIRELILGLMGLEPGQRWTVADARRTLAAAARPDCALPQGPPAREPARLDDERLDASCAAVVAHLLDAMDPADDEALWSESCAQGAPDPCAVQLGAAGTVAVLARHAELTGDARITEAVGTAARWMVRRLRADGERPPALYFGRAGIAWALYEAGRVVGDDDLAEQGLALAHTLPDSTPNPDLTHGTAGIGLAFLHLWHRTGDERFLRRAGASADVLVASVEDGPDGLIWGTPAAFDSRLPGGRYYGFAHGTAGVAGFLLAVAEATGRSDCAELAAQAGETLLGAASIADGLAQWGPGPGDPTTAPYWCHGSAGIGTFLTRLHRFTRDDRFDKVARMAAQAVMENSWRGVLGQCHGLAGNGEFLLDLADRAAGADAARYEAMAHELARVLLASRAGRNGGLVFPDEDGAVSASWAGGSAGILSFLLRLRHRSPRLWMVDAPMSGDRR